MKRQLDSKYSELVDWVNDKKQRLGLREIVVYITCPPRNLYEIIYALYGDNWRSDENLNDTISSIVDIYNDNYELTEPKYFWQLKTYCQDVGALYATRYDYGDTIVLTSTITSEDKMTRNELDTYLTTTNDGLTIDSFKPDRSFE